MSLPSLVCVCLLATAPASQESEQASPEAGQSCDGPLRFELAEGLPPLLIPRGEVLVYDARVTLGPIETTVGEVSLSAGTEEYRAGLLLPSPASGSGERVTGWLKARAVGRYQSLYVLDSEIQTRFLPQAWPRVRYFFQQRGSEHRRREVLIGTRDAGALASYRSDTSRGAPPGTRIWKQPVERSLPYPMALETMGAIYVVRTMIALEQEELVFPMLTKLRLWDVTLRRGEERIQEVSGGRFEAVAVLLSTLRHPDDPDDGRFEGLFGMHGDIRIWVDPRTGIPVRVQGRVPLGDVVDLDCDMQLREWSGTPPSFGPIGAGEQGAGEQGAGEQGAGEQGAGEQGAGEQGAGEQDAVDPPPESGGGGGEGDG